MAGIVKLEADRNDVFSGKGRFQMVDHQSGCSFLPEHADKRSTPAWQGIAPFGYSNARRKVRIEGGNFRREKASPGSQISQQFVALTLLNPTISCPTDLSR